MALELVKSLQDPQLVAQFQRSCGLTLHLKGEANGAASGHSTAYRASTEKTAGGKGVPQENGHIYSNGSYANGTHRQVKRSPTVVIGITKT